MREKNRDVARMRTGDWWSADRYDGGFGDAGVDWSSAVSVT
jgi:hypothetical protein